MFILEREVAKMSTSFRCRISFLGTFNNFITAQPHSGIDVAIANEPAHSGLQERKDPGRTSLLESRLWEIPFSAVFSLGDMEEQNHDEAVKALPFAHIGHFGAC